MKIFVCCPANTVTGGPEAVHQLVDALRSQGHEAFVAYHPFGAGHVVPEPYRGYRTAVAPPVDSEDSLVIVPESMTAVLSGFKRARRLVWWLSIDFFFGWRHRFLLEDRARYLFRRVSGRCASWNVLRTCRHAAQSEYAADFLRRRGLQSLMLGDYLSRELLAPVPASRREPVVLYNPKKGLHVTQALMRACPGLRFRPLVGLSRSELRQVLACSMIYADFGHHPGMDRMPREAAAGGCVVITNRRGSAGFVHDVPIPEAYRIDDTRPGFEARFRETAERVVSSFPACQKEFEGYVSTIRAQEAEFRRQADDLARALDRPAGTPGAMA